jgi:hypothetical protein
MNEKNVVLLRQYADSARRLSYICHKSGIVTPEAMTQGNMALDYLENNLDQIRELPSNDKVYVLQSLFLQCRDEIMTKRILLILCAQIGNQKFAWFLDGELMYGNEIARKVGLEAYSKIGSDMERMMTNLKRYPPK